MLFIWNGFEANGSGAIRFESPTESRASFLGTGDNMGKYSNVCVMIPMAILGLGTAAASVPSTDQLLDRFAANADSHSGSFKIKLENKREVVIRQTDSDFLKPGRRQEHYSLDCRWDGYRVRLMTHSRVGSGTTTVDFGEQVFYESRLCDALAQVYYRKEDAPQEDTTVTYQDTGLSKEDCFNTAVISVLSWPWGYFPEEGGARIDAFLRGSPTARVRPKTEVVNNSECHVLEANSRNAKYTIWFDPAHGYNFARLHFEKPGTRIVVENRLFRKYQAAWVAMETEWEVQIMHLPESDMSYSQKTVVTEFEVDPNHDALRSFVLDDIPEGTKAVFVSGKGHQMPGRFAWHKGKPMPCVDEKTLAQLDSAPESIAGHAMGTSTPDGGKGSFDGVGMSGASSAPHCGLYCLYLIMKMYGQKPSFIDLITPTEFRIIQ